MSSLVAMTLLLLFGGAFLLKRLLRIKPDDVEEEYGRGAAWMITFIVSAFILMWLSAKITLWLFPQARYSLICAGLIAAYISYKIACYVAPPKE